MRIASGMLAAENGPAIAELRKRAEDPRQCCTYPLPTLTTTGNDTL